MRLDHVSYVTSHDQLADTVQRLGSRLGSTFVDGGVHPRFGTRNFTLPLHNGQYIEVVCPLDHPALACRGIPKIIRGGDDSVNRLLPDITRSVISQKKVIIRNPQSTRPWQHVLDPLHGYLLLSQRLLSGLPFEKAYNFGPPANSNLTVLEVCQEALKHWQISTNFEVDSQHFKEFSQAKLLKLDSSRAQRDLDWSTKLDAHEAIAWTVEWEKFVRVEKGLALQITLDQINRFYGSI